MELVDPATGNALPADAIQRVLFISNAVHVYNIPPLATTKGHTAATWTTDPARHIFTARLRLVETSYEDATADRIKVDAVLEDAATGQLFAAAPYTDRAVVEPCLDSSRFFAVTVLNTATGRKAVLGVGFEERPEAFDLGVALQEAGRALGWEGDASRDKDKDEAAAEAKDYSLKEGETITINLGAGKGRRRPQQEQAEPEAPADLQSFALAPPPGAGAGALAPPPSATDVKRRRRQSARDLGFDDGKFGEFE